MNNQVLTIEQMQELIDMGIDVSKASMCYLVIRDHLIGEESTYVVESDSFLTTYLNESNNISIKDTKYTFTLQDILDMLIKYINVNDTVYFLTLMYDVSEGVVISYCSEHIMDILHSEGSSKQINAAFNMLKWCKQNNYI